MEHVNKFKAGIAAATGALTALWGWMGWLAVGWIVCMGLDYLTGSMAAAKEGKWNSARAREGIWHKCGMIVVVLVSVGVDLLLEAALEHLPGIELPFAFGGLVCPMVLVWYIITELGSIAENGVSLGAPVPGWLVKLLEIGKGAVDAAGNAAVDGPAEAARSTVVVEKDRITSTVERVTGAREEELEGIRDYGVGDMPGEPGCGGDDPGALGMSGNGGSNG